jgi:transcriptional regulator with XRE-family HTH domain
MGLPAAARWLARCRELRRHRNLTLEDVAARSGLTKSYLSKVERGLTAPSLAAAERMARAFDVPLSALLGESPSGDGVYVGKVADRTPVVRRGSKVGYTFELLTAEDRRLSMEAYLMRPPRVIRANVWFEHDGAEMIYVLHGRMEMEFATHRVMLDRGDCVYLEAHVRHRSRSLGRTLAEALSIHVYAGTRAPATRDRRPSASRRDGARS